MDMRKPGMGMMPLAILAASLLLVLNAGPSLGAAESGGRGTATESAFDLAPAPPGQGRETAVPRAEKAVAAPRQESPGDPSGVDGPADDGDKAKASESIGLLLLFLLFCLPVLLVVPTIWWQRRIRSLNSPAVDATQLFPEEAGATLREVSALFLGPDHAGVEDIAAMKAIRDKLRSLNGRIANPGLQEEFDAAADRYEAMWAREFVGSRIPFYYYGIFAALSCVVMTISGGLSVLPFTLILFAYCMAVYWAALRRPLFLRLRDDPDKSFMASLMEGIHKLAKATAKDPITTTTRYVDEFGYKKEKVESDHMLPWLFAAFIYMVGISLLPVFANLIAAVYYLRNYVFHR